MNGITRRLLAAAMILSMLAGCGGGSDSTVKLGENEYLVSVEATLNTSQLAGMLAADIPAKQVLIGTMILEVTHNDTDRLSVDFRDLSLTPKNSSRTPIEIFLDVSGQAQGTIYKRYEDGYPRGLSYINLPLAVRSTSSDLTLQETVRTTLSADGETLLLGTFQAADTGEDHDRLPVLGDIPALGFLFSQQSHSATVNELIIVLTPKILKDHE
jgi:type II secretory pathway component GspD/PulD (secretin)